MAKNLKQYEYSVNQVPPAVHLLISAIQHILLMVTTLVFPILFASQMNGTAEFATTLIAFSMLSAGLGSIIQSVGLPELVKIFPDTLPKEKRF